jgi:hypothetical protein
VADLASAYGLAARVQDATNILDQLLEKRRRQYVPATRIARVYSRLGETEQAVAWLETAFDERNGEMVFLQEEIAGAAEGDPLKRLGNDARVQGSGRAEKKLAHGEPFDSAHPELVEG